MTYEIVEDGRAIKCNVCGMTSWSQGDVEHKFCAKCDRFHNQPDPVPLTDDQYELLDYLYHGWNPILLHGSRAYTVRISNSLLQLGLIKNPDSPRITPRGLMAKLAHEALSEK